MSPRENESTVRRIYDELWNERRLEVADEVIAEDATNYDTGLVPGSACCRHSGSLAWCPGPQCGW